MNIQGFAQVEWAYLNPNVPDPMSAADTVVHALGYLFVEQKFIGLFALLFGASSVMLADKARLNGVDPSRIHRRRNVGLLVIGLGHAYGLWSGDILVSYAVAALLLTPTLDWAPERQARTAGVMIGITLILAMILFAEPATVDAATVQAQIEAYRGDWFSVAAERVRASVYMHVVGLPVLGFWPVAGWMLIGMVLYRAGIVQGSRSTRYYIRWIPAWGVPGLALTVLGYGYQSMHDFGLETVGIGRYGLSYLGSIGMTLSYVGLGVLLHRRFKTAAWVHSVQAVGRLALSNYLLQSVLATALFHGYGLGWFERLSLLQLVPVTLAIWIVNILFSRVWTRVARQGPAEWVWRRILPWSTVSRADPSAGSSPR